MDAGLVSPSIASFVSLSHDRVFRRQWSSVYAALQKSRLPRDKLMKLLVSKIALAAQPSLAGDATGWSGPAAQTLRKQSFYLEKLNITRKGTCQTAIVKAKIEAVSSPQENLNEYSEH
jgi:hypothetical protein